MPSYFYFSLLSSIFFLIGHRSSDIPHHFYFLLILSLYELLAQHHYNSHMYHRALGEEGEVAAFLID